MIVIGNGQVLTTEGWMTADVAVSDGVIGAIGDVGGLGGAKTVIDATGCLVGPGFIDLHTHLREPGQTWKEDIASASAAAAAGGYTALTAMPNTEPPMDTVKVVEEVLAAAAARSRVEILPAAAITLGRSGAVPVDFEELYESGVRLFTDDGDSVTDPDVMREALQVIATLPGAVLAQHAEDHPSTAGGHMHEGALSRSLGTVGLSSEAEHEVVRRDLELVAATGGRYHCQHVSARETVELIRRAKDSGLAVTAEVTPHHLTFTVDAVADLDPNFKMYPPLREEDDRAALVKALADGTIDAVATDHAPHLEEEKRVGFAAAPRGVIGLETAAAAVWETLGDRDRFFEVLSIAPSRILGLADHGMPLEVGNPANLVVFDPNETWVPWHFHSKSSNSPYTGRTMVGRVEATIRDGELIHRRVIE